MNFSALRHVARSCLVSFTTRRCKYCAFGLLALVLVACFVSPNDGELAGVPARQSQSQAMAGRSSFDSEVQQWPIVADEVADVGRRFDALFEADGHAARADRTVEIRAAFGNARLADAGASLEDVHCKETICRLVIKFDGDTAKSEREAMAVVTSPEGPIRKAGFSSWGYVRASYASDGNTWSPGLLYVWNWVQVQDDQHAD